MERIASSGVRARAIGTAVDPDAVFAACGREGPASVWWDPSSGERFIGFASALDDVLVVERAGTVDTGVLAAALQERLASDPAGSALLGWWGCLSYELGVGAAGLPIADDDVPLASFAFVDRGIVFEADGTSLIVLDTAPDATEWLDRMAARLVALPPAPELPPPPPVAWRWRHERSAYRGMIAACQAAIRRGDAYQLCLTNTITVEGGAPRDPVAVYRRLRALTPTAHSGVLRAGDRWLLSASPEQFLHIDRLGTARTRPMKGTRPRSSDAETDRGLAADLLASEKERAENLMIVDLMRNDLSRVSRIGSVAVTELFGVETFGFSHQLVSTVESVLDADPVEAVLALFPAGSMTGAPKHAAMRILGLLEAGPRGTYAGVWGRLSLDGSVDLAVVIRSIVLEGDRVLIGSGGGITAQSDPAAEWDEVVLKARSMLLAIGADPDEAP